MTRRPAALAIAVVVVLLTCLTLVAETGKAPGAAKGRDPAAYAAHVGADRSHPTDTTDAELARRVGSVVAEDPAAVRLPSGARLQVAGVSSEADGDLAVPSDIAVAGWWQGGSRVGDPFGSTLLAAHVDSTIQGLGPFAELLSVRPGARVQVTSQHLTQAFRVRTLRLVPQDGLADKRWIFSSRGPRRLVLVTCAPPYDRSHGGYQNLAVVVAVPLDAPTRRTGR